MKQLRDEIKLGFFVFVGLSFSLLIFLTTFIYIKESYSIPQKQEIIQGKFIQKIIKKDRLKSLQIPPTKKPKVALIIDDCGFNINDNIKKLVKLGIKLNFAVIPGFKYSKKFAWFAYKYGHEILIHMPMQSSKNNMSAYKIKILTNMSDSEIFKNIEASLSEISLARGINNHEGSIATEDIKTMEAVLNKIKELNLYFVDSLTTPRSKVYKIAQKLNISCIRNDIFIDHINNITTIYAQIKKLITLAKKRGYAVGIGHITNNNTITAICQLSKYIKTQVDTIGVSELLNKK